MQTDVYEVIDALDDEQQRADSKRLIELFKQLSGEPPKMWYSGTIGFGRYHYRYDSGREGDFFRIGFAPRKGKLSIHILPDLDRFEATVKKLGQYKTGRSCLYVKRLDDIDVETLQQLARQALEEMNRLYPPES